jgi:hypothetical protein
MAEVLKFEVGSTYENMKGPYEVLSIQNDAMVIRWQDGLEMVTSVEVQQRILERMAYDKEEAGRVVKPKKSSDDNKKKKSAPFSGLTEEDFANTSKTMTWRGRNSIGGAVIKQLNSDEMDFGAWAMSAQPELHWMEKSRHERRTPHHGIGFYARVDAKAFSYGVYVKPAALGGQAFDCWDALKAWLTSPANESWLKQQFKDHDLCLRDASRKVLTHDITLRGDHWEYKEGKVRHKIESLAAHINGLVDLSQADLRIEKRLSKAETLPTGKKIAGTIASLFHDLMPFYLVSPAPEP